MQYLRCPSSLEKVLVEVAVSADWFFNGSRQFQCDQISKKLVAKSKDTFWKKNIINFFAEIHVLLNTFELK